MRVVRLRGRGFRRGRGQARLQAWLYDGGRRSGPSPSRSGAAPESVSWITAGWWSAGGADEAAARCAFACVQSWTDPFIAAAAVDVPIKLAESPAVDAPDGTRSAPDDWVAYVERESAEYCWVRPGCDGGGGAEASEAVGWVVMKLADAADDMAGAWAVEGEW